MKNSKKSPATDKEDAGGQLQRVSIILNAEQRQIVHEKGLNLSGLVRDLLHDRFSHRKVVLSVSPETRAIYDQAISNFGANDQELEDHFLAALDSLLKKKMTEIEALRGKISKS